MRSSRQVPLQYLTRDVWASVHVVGFLCMFVLLCWHELHRMSPLTLYRSLYIQVSYLNTTPYLYLHTTTIQSPTVRAGSFWLEIPQKHLPFPRISTCEPTTSSYFQSNVVTSVAPSINFSSIGVPKLMCVFYHL